MKQLAFAIAFLASSFAHSATEESPPDSALAEQVAMLNTQSKAMLGVSLLALSLLENAGPGRFFPKEMLVESGSWDHYQELEARGLITLNVSNGLPDGSVANTEIVAVSLTALGEELKAALHKP